MLGLNALSKCSGREFSDRNRAASQPRYDSRSTSDIHKRYCNSSRTVLENGVKTKETLGEIFL
jgi:hypothetical protein